MQRFVDRHNKRSQTMTVLLVAQKEKEYEIIPEEEIKAKC